MDGERRPARAGAHVLHIRCRPGTDDESYRQLLDLIGETTPVVQALPPAAALADVAGSLRYFRATPLQLARRIRAQAMERYGIDTRVGVAPNWTLAAMASARPAPEGITFVDDTPEAIAAFLDPLPVGALYGIGPVQAELLTTYGLHTIGALAATPASTVQRILGGRAGRLIHDRARGIDPRPVSTSGLPPSLSEHRRLAQDTLDPARIRTTLLEMVVALGEQLRHSRQTARALSLTVTFADRTSLTRSRTLAEASAHTEDLRLAAYQAFDALGLQRARVRALTVRAEQLGSAETATEQLTLDRTRESRLRAEPAIDRANARYGSGTVRPASLRGPRRRRKAG